MSDDYSEKYSGIQDRRENSSSILNYKDELKIFGSGSVIASGIMLPAELAEEVYGPSDFYSDSAEFAGDVYLEGSELVHEGLDMSFELINSLL